MYIYLPENNICVSFSYKCESIECGWRVRKSWDGISKETFNLKIKYPPSIRRCKSITKIESSFKFYTLCFFSDFVSWTFSFFIFTLQTLSEKKYGQTIQTNIDAFLTKIFQILLKCGFLLEKNVASKTIFKKYYWKKYNGKKPQTFKNT